MPPTRTRRRRVTASADGSVAAAQKLVNELISENRRLRRENAKLRADSGTRTAGRQPKSPAEKALTAISRQVQRALGATSSAGSTRRRSISASPAKRARKPITDPAVLQRRREALEKARRVRAEKRAAAS
jgi:hypothetical protein